MKRIYNNINLANRNSFGVVESAATLVEFDTVNDLREYFTTQKPECWYVLGAGNNTLFTKFYDGTLIVPMSGARTILSDDGERVDVRVEAAHDWDEFVAWSVEQGLWGIENLSAIPSSVGAAPVQNIGAYGAEAKDTITFVEYFDTRTMEVVRLSNEEPRNKVDVVLPFITSLNRCTVGNLQEPLTNLATGKVAIDIGPDI